MRNRITQLFTYLFVLATVMLTSNACSQTASSVKMTCSKNVSFFLKGDVRKDETITVTWDNKDYLLPRGHTSSNDVDVFIDPASGFKLVSSPNKVMLFRYKDDGDGQRLADECQPVSH